MSLTRYTLTIGIHSFPRVSGDEPEIQLIRERRSLFSPRERG